MTLEVITFGEVMVLMLAEPGMPLPAATCYRRSIAGAEANLAIGLARLGHQVGWFGRVGVDPFGDVVLRALRAESVDVSRVIRDRAPTGLLVRDCHAERPVEVLYYRRGSAGSRLSDADVDRDYLAGARLLHVTGITPVLSESARHATHAAIEAARASGVIVCFDPNVRTRLCPPAEAAEVLRPIAAHAGIVLAGEDEAELLSGRAAPDRAAGWFLDRGASFVVLKRGDKGAWATDGKAVWEREAVPVTCVDPVGAGDAFAAGFLSAWLRGLDPGQVLAEATLVSARAVQVPGDIEGLPDPGERDAGPSVRR